MHIETQHGAPAVVLDLTGCLPVHGGLSRVRARVVRGLGRRGVVHALGAASTALGALAVSAVSAVSAVTNANARGVHGVAASTAHQPPTLSTIPVSALRLEPSLVEGLRELHILTVGQLLVIDRRALGDRFGPQVAAHVDALTGRRPWPFNAVPPPDRAAAEFVFASPCAQLEAVQAAMHHAVDRLCAELDRRMRSVSVLQVRVERARMPAVRGLLYFGVPTRSAQHLSSLLAPRVERMQLGCHEHGMGIERIELVALRVGSARADATHQAVGQLVDQLTARLGEGSVQEAGAMVPTSPPPSRPPILLPRDRHG